MNVANKCKDNIKTERQWNLEGFKIKAGVKGERMWTNQFCGNISTYFRETEVEPMNPEEKVSWHEADRLRRNEMVRQSRKRRIEEDKRLEREWKFKEEAREREWREWKDAAAAKLVELEKGESKLAMVHIEGYGAYIYEVPADIKPGTVGMFPFGEFNKSVQGTIERFVEPTGLDKEEWFPYGLKKMII